MAFHKPFHRADLHPPGPFMSIVRGCTSGFMTNASFFTLTGILLLATGCATIRESVCPSGQQSMVNELLYFGTIKPRGMVSAEDWRSFLTEVVTPRFPQGLSVWSAYGQWKADAGPIISEDSYVLNVTHPGGLAQNQALDQIAGAYKAKFQQEAVLRVSTTVCVSLYR